MDLFFAVSDPRRREIVRLVAERGGMSAGEICGKLDVTAQAVSQHLRVLREAGILIMEKDSQKRIYKINAEAFLVLEQWARATTKVWDERLARLDKLLQTEKISAKNRVRIWQKRQRS